MYHHYSQCHKRESEAKTNAKIPKNEANYMSFLRKEVNMLDHVATYHRYITDPDKTKAIHE